MRFVADQRARCIHDVERQTNACNLHALSGRDQVPIADPGEVKLMLEQQGWVACPECMEDFGWD